MAGIRYDENKGKILHYSYLSEYRPELTGAIAFDKQDNGTFRTRFLSVNYADLYHIAYAGDQEHPYDRTNRIVREDTNPLKHGYDANDLSNHFCYDLIFRDTTVAGFSKYMIEDLDRYLGFKSHEEIRKIKTLVIRPNGKGTAYKTRLYPDRKYFMEHSKFTNGKPVILNNIDVIGLNRNAMTYAKIPTVFDLPKGTRLNMNINWNIDNLEAMNQELRKFDLVATIEDRDTKVIVLRDPN